MIPTMATKARDPESRKSESFLLIIAQIRNPQLRIAAIMDWITINRF